MTTPVALLVAVLLVVGCTRSDGQARLSRALCADLDRGATVHQINPFDTGDLENDHEWFAHQVHLAVTDECPRYTDAAWYRRMTRNWNLK